MLGKGADVHFLVHPHEAIGKYLGGYQILSQLGSGKLGITYKVRSAEKDREYALKVFRLPSTISLEWQDRFQAYLAQLVKLQHPYLNRVYTSGKVDSFWYVVQELVHDGTGNALNVQGYAQKHQSSFSPFQLYHLARQVGKALEYIHTVGEANVFLHGNLSLQNILIAWESSQEDGRAPFEVRLADPDLFGLFGEDLFVQAFREWKENPSIDRFGQDYLEEGTLPAIFNFSAFMAPESLEGRRFPQSDLYALGQVLYVLATGTFAAGYLKPLSELNPHYSNSWNAMIQRLLEPSPQHRYPDVGAFLEDLEGVIGEEVGSLAAIHSPAVKVRKLERGALTPVGMVYIPRGQSLVGNAKCGEDALPQHTWETEGFYLDRTPVTNGQFREFVMETGYLTEVEEAGEGAVWMGTEWKMLKGVCWKNPMGQELPGNFESHPVTQVTYRDAKAYAEWAGRRLPTEFEWEHAAQGGMVGADYPWGQHPSHAHANYGSKGTVEVMSFPANGFGLYDMAGNVWEWTDSWYQAYPGNFKKNMHFGDKYRVVRGGAWLYDGFHCMLAYRNANQPDIAYPTLGFRTAADVRKRNFEKEEG